MSAPVRFLAVAVFGWVTVRAAGQVLLSEPLAPAPVPPAEKPLLNAAPQGPANADVGFAPLDAASAQPGYGYPPGYAYGSAATPSIPQMAAPRPYPLPVYYPVAAPASPYPAALPRGPVSTPQWLGEPYAGPDFRDMPASDEAPEPKLALADSGALPRVRSVPSFVGKPAAAGGLDRLSLSAWTLVRQSTAVAIDRSAPTPAAPVSLASGGQLGGSQAGARLTYRFSRSLAANLRVSAPMNPATQKQLAGEAALGVSWQPLAKLPLRVMAERRQRFGGPAGGGRNAFAVLAEGGVYGQSLPWDFRLDGYGQAGVVSVRDRAWFVDGGATVSRPLFGRFALGAGSWGGAQQGAARLDVGPRMSMQLFPGIRTHLDYRYRLLGKAQPGSGWAVTVGADF